MQNNFFKIDKKDVETLHYEWCDLALSYTSDKILIDNIFNILQKKYEEKHRTYHNLSHIRTLLNLCKDFKDSLKDYNTVRFAVWFHDAIYNTKRRDNEQQSAGLASQLLSRLGAQSSECVQMIEATKDHYGRGLSADVRLFLDMDLAILGASEEIYTEYAKAVRDEYSWVPDLLYRRGRREVLEAFLEREAIYLTEEMRERYEVQARKNISSELRSV